MLELLIALVAVGVFLWAVRTLIHDRREDVPPSGTGLTAPRTDAEPEGDRREGVTKR